MVSDMKHTNGENVKVKYVGRKLPSPLEGLRFGVYKVQSGGDVLIALVLDARRMDRIVDMLNGE